MNFPNQICIRVVDKQGNVPVSGITLQIILFAHYKNDYHLLSGLSDLSGIIEIKKSWLTDEIYKERSLFIMDYGSSLEQCLPKIHLCLPDDIYINKAKSALREWIEIIPYVAKEIQILEQCCNASYHPVSFDIDINEATENQVFDLSIEKRRS